MNSNSYAVNNAAAPFTYMQSGAMKGIKSSYGSFSNMTHTCTWLVNTSPSNSVVLITLPYYLEIKEIYH
jgi:hypothetical protein